MSREMSGEIDTATEARMIRIMRYCDGDLPPQEAAAVAQEIAADPASADLVESFALGDAAARSAWAELESGPVPLAMARRVSEAAHKRPALAMSTAAPSWRMAAAIMVGLAMGALGMMLIGRGEDHGLRLAGTEAPGADAVWRPALVAALRQDPALGSISFGQDGKDSIAIVRWFDTASAMRCAEYTLSRGAAHGGGIACRRGDGGWDVIAQDQ